MRKLHYTFYKYTLLDDDDACRGSIWIVVKIVVKIAAGLLIVALAVLVGIVRMMASIVRKIVVEWLLCKAWSPARWEGLVLAG